MVWPVVVSLIIFVGYIDTAPGRIRVNDEYVPLSDFPGAVLYGNHSFFDGELVKISCDGKLFQPNYIQLSYVSANRRVVTKKQNTNLLEMYLKLAAENDGAHIDCDITNGKNSPSDFKVQRIYFKLQSTNKATLGYQVNGLTLTHKFEQKDGLQFLYFKYEYYDGEELEIISLKHEQKYGLLQCSLPNELNYVDLLPNSSNIHLLTTPKDDQRISIKCMVGMKKGHNHDGRGEKNIEMSLELVPHIRKTFDINGLSMAHILQMYKKNINSTVIVYEYNDDRNLSLQCYSVTEPHWDYKPAEIEKADSRLYTSSKYSNLNVASVVFKLNPHQTSAVVKCVSPNSTKTITIRLVRRKKNDTSITEYSKTKLIIAACGIVLSVTFIVALIKVIFQKTKHTTQNVETPDVNNEIPDHYQRQMPEPIQLSEYAVPFDGTETYSVPYTTKPDYETRSTLRNNQQPVENNVTYAELQLGSAEGYARVRSKRDDDNYVQILQTKRRS